MRRCDNWEPGPTLLNASLNKRRHNKTNWITRDLFYASAQTTSQHSTHSSLVLTSCAGGRHNMPPTPASSPLDLESSVRVTYDVGYLSANFSLPRPLFSN